MIGSLVIDYGQGYTATYPSKLSSATRVIPRELQSAAIAFHQSGPGLYICVTGYTIRRRSQAAVIAKFRECAPGCLSGPDSLDGLHPAGCPYLSEPPGFA